VGAAVLGLGAARNVPHPAEALLPLQVFLATATFCSLGVAAVLDDLRRANQRARNAEQELRHIVETSADIVVRLQSDGRISWVTPSVRRLGYAPEEMIGQGANAFIHPEDLPAVLALRDALFADRPVPLGEGLRFRLRRRDGSWEWVEGNPSIARDSAGSPVSMTNVLRDITAQMATERELTASEARYRELADAIPDLVVTIAGGLITYASDSSRQLGFAPSEIIGRPISDFVHPDDLADALDRAGDHARGQIDPSRRREQRIRRKDGGWLWMEGNPRPVHDAEGVVREVVYTFRDISRRKALEAELIDARDAAEDAARVKADFMANMSHEIRTPLTAILGFTSLLRSRTDLSPEAEHQVARISAAGQSLLAIVNDILDFSKIEAGQMPIRPRPTPLGETLAESLALFEPQAAAKGITLDLQAGDLGYAEVDSDRLQQVLLNLIGNAVKFTETGGVTVIAAYDENRERLKVTVRDSGPGMDEAQQARLFQRFSHVGGSTARRHGGTGLGLAICRGLVEAMGGEIGVTSQRGSGSTFRFEIDAPRCEAPAPMQDDAPLADLKSVRVLVADDNPVNRELVKALLSSIGMEVTEVADGAEAVAAAQALPYDIILMDIRMPNLDGPDATLKIRTQPGPNRGVPILAFTADHDLERFGEQATRGFDGKVAKPIDGAQLVTEIARHLALGVTDAA
jgi:PAS domain S-box-containing protein